MVAVMCEVLHGDCLDRLRDMPDNSVDAIVTDPPYGLSNTTPDKVADTIVRWASGEREHVPEGRGFMGRPWDAFVPPPAVWDECLRVLKPGGHMAVFAGSRTQDLMGLSIRLAGFEIRDTLAWIYGSGFSKGGLLKNRKGIDWCSCPENAVPLNNADIELPRMRECVYQTPVSHCESESPGLLKEMQRTPSRTGMGEARTQGPGSMERGDRSRLSGEDNGRGEPVLEGRNLHRAGQGVPDGSDAEPSSRSGERVRGGALDRNGEDDWQDSGAAGRGSSHQRGPGGQQAGEPETVRGSHVALDDGALRDGAACPRCGGMSKEFEGVGPCLKPAQEPILCARKPLDGTVAANVLEWGTGALNIDASRVGSDGGTAAVNFGETRGGMYGGGKGKPTNEISEIGKGRFPANVLLDEHAAQEMDKQSGPAGSNSTSPGSRGVGMFGSRTGGATHDTRDSGGASRFFPVFKYQAKAPKRERPVIERPPMLQLRDDLTPEQVDHVRARLAEAGVQVD